MSLAPFYAKFERTIYSHPDGDGLISYNPMTKLLTVSKPSESVSVEVPLIQWGLREIARQLLNHAASMDRDPFLDKFLKGEA